MHVIQFIKVTYCIRWISGVEFILAVWRTEKICQIECHQYQWVKCPIWHLRVSISGTVENTRLLPLKRNHLALPIIERVVPIAHDSYIYVIAWTSRPRSILNSTLNLTNLSHIVLSPGLAALETRLSHMVIPLFLCTPYPIIKLLNFSCSAKACTNKCACLATVVCIAIGRSPNNCLTVICQY